MTVMEAKVMMIMMGGNKFEEQAGNPGGCSFG